MFSIEFGVAWEEFIILYKIHHKVKLCVKWSQLLEVHICHTGLGSNHLTCVLILILFELQWQIGKSGHPPRYLKASRKVYKRWTGYSGIISALGIPCMGLLRGVQGIKDDGGGSENFDKGLWPSWHVKAPLHW